MKPPTSKTTLIIGQGIAGSMLAYHFHKANLAYQIIDKQNPNASSRIAAGLINPITGRVLAKSWLFHRLSEYAHQIYPELEQLLGISCFTKTQLFRLLKTEKERNEFSLRVELPEYDGWMSEAIDISQLQGLSYGEAKAILIHGVAISLGSRLLPAFRKWFQKQRTLTDASFDFSQLRFSDTGSVFYKEQEYQRVIFAEGFRMKDNPYFNYLPMIPAKGDRLIIHCPELQLKDCAKISQTLIPVEKPNHYWVGSNYNHNEVDEIPRESGRQKILEKLEEMLPLPFEIVEHKAAPRPTTKDRRPLIGLHPKYPQLGVFNGMGSKGFSLAPLLAAQFVNFLSQEEELHPRVSIRRFDQHYTMKD